MAKPLLPDELWERIEPLLPPPRPRRFRYPGRKPVDNRKALTGILFVLKTGIPWEDLPQEMGCGSGMTCWRRLHDWQHAGVWGRLVELRPAVLYTDRAYDSATHRARLRARGIRPRIARRRTGHGSGLGVFRWVVERTIAWLHGFRKLRLVTEKGLDMQYAFLNLAHGVILWRLLQPSLC